MLSPNDPIVFADLVEQARALQSATDWQAFRPGAAAHWLYNEGNGGPAAVLLRYEAGARVAEHEHVGYEHMFVLEGDEFDEHGSYPAGSFVVNPPGTRAFAGQRGRLRGPVDLREGRPLHRRGVNRAPRRIEDTVILG